MADLKVDIDQLDLLRLRLERALEVIREDSDIAAEIGHAVGHDLLRVTLEHFSNSWNKHRFEIRDNLTWLKDSTDKIGDSFVSIDTELANALTAPAHTQPTNGPVAV